MEQQQKQKEYKTIKINSKELRQTDSGDYTLL
jgi:hypothetical protein